MEIPQPDHKKTVNSSLPPERDTACVSSWRRLVNSLCTFVLITGSAASMLNPEPNTKPAFGSADQTRMLRVTPKKDPLCRKWYDGDMPVWECLCEDDSVKSNGAGS